MLAFGLRVLYAGEVLDFGLLPLLPGGCPAAEPGAGGRPVQPGANPGNPALPCLRAARPPGRAAALLLRGLRPRRTSGTEAGLYAKTAGLVSGKLDPLKPACIKALPGPFRGGAYHFTSCPCFPLILSTFHTLRGGYYGRKSRLCHPAVHFV